MNNERKLIDLAFLGIPYLFRLIYELVKTARKKRKCKKKKKKEKK